MRSIFCLFVLTASLAAQSSFSPGIWRDVEGTIGNVYPFGDNTAASTPFRYQQIHDDVPASLIFGLSFRHDSNPDGIVRAPFTVTVDIWISTSPNTSATPDATFDNNHGTDKIHAVINRTIPIPGNDPSSVPNPFQIDIPFDNGVVFFYTGGASVCWEVQVTARTNTAFVPFDAFQNFGAPPANPILASSRAFLGCVATGRTQPMSATAKSNAEAPMDWIGGIGRLGCSGSQLAANGIVAFVYGTDRTQWNGLPLPLDVPGSAAAPSGTCTLHTDFVFAVVGLASAPGTASSVLTFPLAPALQGLTIDTQILGLDPAANPAGVTTSNLVVQQIVAPYTVPLGVSRIFAAGSLGPTGTTTPDALVTKFL